jgi:hypothetical protein
MCVYRISTCRQPIRGGSPAMCWAGMLTPDFKKLTFYEILHRELYLDRYFSMTKFVENGKKLLVVVL